MTGMQLAKIGYNAYCEAVGGKSAITGDPLPEFDKTPPAVQTAWIAAAISIHEACNENN